MGRADAVTVRISHDWCWDCFHNIGRGISLLAFAALLSEAATNQQHRIKTLPAVLPAGSLMALIGPPWGEKEGRGRGRRRG